MREITFTGEEPFHFPMLVSPILEFCKVDLDLESVSIVTNRNKLAERLLERSAKHIDTVTVS